MLTEIPVQYQGAACWSVSECQKPRRREDWRRVVLSVVWLYMVCFFKALCQCLK